MKKYAQHDKHPNSYYQATVNDSTKFDALSEEINCDICIVGGGFTGLTASIFLAKKSYKVVLLEARRVGSGASGRNGGQLGSGQRRDQFYLEEHFGNDMAMQMWRFAEEARNTALSLIKDYQIQCDLKQGVLYAAPNEQDRGWCLEYAELINKKYGYDKRTYLDRNEMSQQLGTDIYHGGSLDLGCYHLHPLNYAKGLARTALSEGVKIFENSPAEKISDTEKFVQTPKGTVKCKYIIIACNAYLGNLFPKIRNTFMPINNYMIATEPLSNDVAKGLIANDYAVCDTNFVVNYYRLSSDKRLLFGGGETYRDKFPSDIKNFVRKYMLKVYPQMKNTSIDYGWGGSIAITLNRVPDFGKAGKNIFYAQGFSGHGVALTSLAGKLLSEAISGTAERFDVFANLPKKKFPGGRFLKTPALFFGMLYYSLLDRLR